MKIFNYEINNKIIIFLNISTLYSFTDMLTPLNILYDKFLSNS